MAWETVLIVDDDPIIAQALSAFLQEREFETVVARDAMQATMAIRRSAPAVILLDIILPGGSGLEVLKRLGAASAEPIPVVGMSASNDPELPDKVRSLGGQAFLRKPFELEAAYILLCRLLGRPYEPPESAA